MNNLSSNERIALHDFFGGYFYGDFLDNPSDITEALEDYLNSGDDPGGSALLAGVSKLANAPDYSEDAMIELIEKKWRSDGMAKEFGYTYKDVFSQISSFLSAHSKKSGANEPRADVFLELITKYAPQIGEQHVHMMREDYEHNEGQVAFENFVDSLAEMDVKVAAEDLYSLKMLAELYDRLDYPAGKGVYW